MAAQFSIDSYWLPRFREARRVTSNRFLPGWSAPQDVSRWFVEPDLAIRTDCGPADSRLVLVSAAGAVGKSMLAKTLCARAGIVFVDLTKSATVAGNFLSGGIFRAGGDVSAAANEGKLGLVIDALDEARLRVKPQSFIDFLTDTLAVLADARTPIVLLGRTGIVDECWRWFKDAGTTAAVFDIEMFDEERAVRFVELDLRRRAEEFDRRRRAEELEKKKRNTDARQGLLRADGLSLAHIEKYAGPYKQAARDFVTRLSDVSSSTESDVEERVSDRGALQFAGYAPVLDAVGAMLSETPNPSAMEIVEERSRDVLYKVVDRILRREQDKFQEGLATVFGSIPPHPDLYGPEEQRRRLLARLTTSARQPSTPAQVPQFQQKPYEDAVESFLAQHPFLDGTGTDVSSAVFSADLISFALLSGEVDLRRSGEEWAERSTSAPNPFLIDFYSRPNPVAGNQAQKIFVTPEHVGLLDASMRARLRAGEHATFEFQQEEGHDDAIVYIEIVRSRDGREESVEKKEFRSSAAGTLRLTRKVSNATVQANDLDLELGDGHSCELSAPIFFDVDKLRFSAKELIVSRAADRTEAFTSASEAVAIFATSADANAITKSPLVAEGVTLRVGWPAATVHPWTNFAVSPRVADDPKLAEAQRALRRLVVSFRSHSKGQLARFKGKIEHRRMTKGEVGESIRQELLADGVLVVQGVYYVLEPDVLGAKLGTDYASLRDKIFSDQVNDYLTKLLKKRNSEEGT